MASHDSSPLFQAIPTLPDPEPPLEEGDGDGIGDQLEDGGGGGAGAGGAADVVGTQVVVGEGGGVQLVLVGAALLLEGLCLQRWDC